MAYEIRYGKSKYEKKQKRTVYRKWFPVVLLIVLIMGILFLDVDKTTMQWLLPGDPAVTAMALENMQQNLKSGETVFEAVSVFCQEVVDGAKIPQ